MKPDATPTSAWTERGERRGLPSRPPSPPTPRPRRSPPARGPKGLRGEGRGSAVKEAAAGYTVCGVARPREEVRNSTGAAEHGTRAQEDAGSSEAREERGSHGAQMKRSLPLPEQPAPKRMKLLVGSEDPSDRCKPVASPLGPGAWGKAAPRPPLPSTKDDVLPPVAVTSVPNKVPAWVSMAGGSCHVGDARAEASHKSIVSAANGLPDIGDALTYKERSAGTAELQRKKNGFSLKPRIVSVQLLGRTSNARSRLGGDVPGAWRKAAPLPPLPSTKDDVLPRSAVTSVPNKVPAWVSMAGGSRHVGDTRAGALHQRIVSAADGLLETGDMLTYKERSAGTGELQRKKNGFSLKPRMVSVQLLGHTSNARSRLGGNARTGRGSTDTQFPSKAVCADSGSGVSNAVLTAVDSLEKGPKISTVAERAMKEITDFSVPGPVVGQVRGVEIGDQFQYRAQLAVFGLHRGSWGGIDYTNKNGTPIALSIVCSGGYPDKMVSSGELIYTGSGGKLAGKDGDQKLERGNLALKNCIITKSPVRVIYGFTNVNIKGHKTKTYVYDGLYHVVHFCQEGEPGSRMFKYTLKKIPGQPELPHHIAEQMMSKKRRGLCMNDISRGKEKTCIPVINMVDEARRPAFFSYITGIKSTKAPPLGCGCTRGCSDSDSCSCARRNGGKLPFNSDGALVSESSFIFECGPSCKCPSSCCNRVSQCGITVPLEVFRTTNAGWGLRSLSSIPSGSFVCEYAGELRHSMEADQRNNSIYLFNIGQSNCLQQEVSVLNSSSNSSGTMDAVGFTIDATKCGNVGRFINLSSSPNLFAQNVLWDHDDKRMPHVMFFAMETIPPLQELTCEY